MTTPRSFRSSAVSFGRTLPSIAFSRKAASYWPRPRLRSQSPTSMVAARKVPGHDRPDRTWCPGRTRRHLALGHPPANSLLDRKGSESARREHAASHKIRTVRRSRRWLFEDRGVVRRRNRPFVIGGARDPHQSTSFCDAEGVVRLNSILRSGARGEVVAPLFLLMNRRRARRDSTPKIAYTVLP